MFKNIRRMIHKLKMGVKRKINELRTKIDDWRRVLSWTNLIELDRLKGKYKTVNYKVLWTWGHYTVYKDNDFMCSADTVEEAEQEIKKDIYGEGN